MDAQILVYCPEALHHLKDFIIDADGVVGAGKVAPVLLLLLHSAEGKNNIVV